MPAKRNVTQGAIGNPQQFINIGFWFHSTADYRWDCTAQRTQPGGSEPAIQTNHQVQLNHFG